MTPKSKARGATSSVACVGEVLAEKTYHGFGRDAGVGVHLLQDLVDVDLVGLGLGLALAALTALGDGLLGGLLGGGSLGHRE